MKRTIERLRAEFLEMPGLRLNVKQVQRLCGVDEMLCQDVLDALVDLGFLRMNRDGSYARVTDGHDPGSSNARQAPSSPHFKRAS